MPDRGERHAAIATALLLLASIVAEVAQRVLLLPGTIGAVALLLGLVPIAYAGLRARLPVAIGLAFALAAYTVHWSAPPGQLLAMDAEGATAFAAMLFLGFGMVVPMALIQRRERQLRKALEQRAHEVEARNRELTEANDALEAFGYVVSHDLKEPVRGIENYLDAAREEFGTPDSRRFVEEAYQANRRLSRLLQGLLDYSRTSSIGAEARPTSIQEAVLGDVCRSRYGPIAIERDATVDILEGIPPVKGDEVLIAQLFGNVILNGIRHDPHDKPQVRIRHEPHDEGVHVVVEDRGPGFPREVIERVNGLRTHRPATVKGGFGLVIAHRAAQRLGGRLWIANGPHGGEVHVLLPQSDGATARSTA